MDKLRLHQIINILILPYCQKEFCDINQDIIAQIRFAFAQLHRKDNEMFNKMEQARKIYYEKERMLVEFLHNHTELRGTSLDDLRLQLNLFYPEIEITELYHSYLFTEKYCVQAIDIFYLENIFRTAGSLLTFRDGKMAIRQWMNEKDIFKYPNIFDKVEIWNFLSRMMVPDIFIAAFYAETGMTEPFRLYGQGNNIELADKILEKVLCKGTAETHMHFNAGMDSNYFWQRSMDPRRWENAVEEKKKYESFCAKNKIKVEIVYFRILCAVYLERGTEKYADFASFIAAFKMKDLTDMMKNMFEGKEVVWTPKLAQIHKTLMQMFEEQERDENDFLFVTEYRKYRYLRTSSELIFLFKCMSFFKEHSEDISMIHLFFQYVRKKNQYFSSMVQANYIQGLTNFSLYYREMGRRQNIISDLKTRYEVILRNISTSGLHLKKLEIRIALDMSRESGRADEASKGMQLEIKHSILERVAVILKAYRKNMREALHIWSEEYEMTENDLERLDELCRSGEAMFPAIGIIIHFVKRDAVDNRVGNMCWVRSAEKGGKSNHILIVREKMVLWATMIEELRSSIPGLAKYIVGIDAASEENNAEPWVFAPVYAAIRNRRITRPLIQNDNMEIFRVNNIGFTYHVGEEFRHLLSGLRHIDEVIEHYFYKSEDRIGHAIALGTDVEEWTMRNDVVTIPVMEQLENLLWLWGNMVYRDWVVEIATEVLEGKILSYAKDIYGEINGMTVHMLFDAYQEKFKFLYRKNFVKMGCYIKDSPEIENAGAEGIGHFCKYYTLKESPYGLHWTKEKIFCTFFCPLYYARMQRPIFVSTDMEQSIILKKAQQYVLKEVEQKGIYIETNPTSNLAIGESRELYDEHILRLNSKDLTSTDEESPEVLITINSDDPVIFSTNTENELAYIYYALVYKGYTKERVLRWIDKVRQMGIDSSFIKEEISASQQYREIERLLDEIEQYFLLERI